MRRFRPIVVVFFTAVLACLCVCVSALASSVPVIESEAVLARWEPIGQRFQSGGERRCRVVSVAGRGVGSVGAGICRGIRREGGAARLRREA